MPHVLWRIFVATVCYVAFIYIAPLFLSVLELSIAGNLWALIKALAAVGAVAYVIWGQQKWPGSA